MDYEELIHAYEVDTEFPDVSGIELLDMLLARSDIARFESELTDEQRTRVYKADQRFIEDAPKFYASIQRIAHLEQWRSEHNPQSSDWWWYLDVIAQLEKTFTLSIRPPGEMPSTYLRESVVHE